MKKKEKQDLIIQLIASERERYEQTLQCPVSSISICPYEKDKTILNNIPFDEILQILKRLQSEENILIIRHVDVAEGIQHIDEEPWDVPWSRPERIDIELTEDFIPWHKAYQKSKKIALSDMSVKTARTTLDFLEALKDPLAVNGSHTLTLTATGNIPIPDNAVLNLLQNNGVLLDFTPIASDLKIKVDIDRIGTFQKELIDYLAKNKEPATTCGNIAIQLPPAKEWKDITIQFKNGHDVTIKVGDKSIHADYKQLGFVDARNQKPDEQWLFLSELAENNGIKSWQANPPSKIKVAPSKLTYDDLPDEDDSAGNHNPGFQTIKAPDTYRQRKRNLTNKLKELFHLKDDPFWPYSKAGGYQIKIRLIPA